MNKLFTRFSVNSFSRRQRVALARPYAGAVTMLAFCLACIASPITLAERADRAKPIEWEAAKGYNEAVVNGVSANVFEGQVVVTQGTLKIMLDRLVMRENKEGFKSGEGVGNPAFFTQKRDDRDDYLEVYAKRVEFDEKLDTIRFIGDVRLKAGRDELSAELIVYNTLTETYRITGADGKPGEAGKRVKAILFPKAAATEPSKAPAK